MHGTPVENDAEADSESSGDGNERGDSDSDDSGDSGDSQDDDDPVPVPVPAIPFAGLVGLAVALVGSGTLRRRRPSGRTRVAVAHPGAACCASAWHARIGGVEPHDR